MYAIIPVLRYFAAPVGYGHLWPCNCCQAHQVKSEPAQKLQDINTRQRLLQKRVEPLLLLEETAEGGHGARWEQG